MSMDTKKIIKEHGFVFKKKFGQNFITNSQVLSDIVEKAEIENDDIVIEIGPGAGSLTGALAKKAKKVIAVEIDTSLEPILKQSLAEHSNTEVIFEDVLKWDLKTYLEENYPNEKIKVVANLPYYITTPILMKLLEEKLPLKSITIMVQKEVADRIQAAPGCKDYGAITLAVAYYADARIVMTVPPHIFTPAPKVMSAVLHLKMKETSPLAADNDMAAKPSPKEIAKTEKQLFAVISAAFEQRRKTLINALSNKGIATKEKIKESLTQMQLPETIRGEKLSLQEYITLTQKLQTPQNPTTTQ